MTITLPDSLGGAAGLTCAALNPITGKLYVGGKYGNAVVAVDGASGTRAARIPVESEVSSICVNTVNNKVYAAVRFGTHVTIVDGADDHVITELPVTRWPRTLCYSPVSNKVYCVATDTLYVIDGATDLITKRMQFSWRWDRYCYDSRRDRIFLGQYDGADAYLLVFDCATDSVVDTTYVENITLDMCYEPVTDRVYSAQNTVVCVIDPATDSIIAFSPRLWNAAIASDGARNRLYCAQDADDTLYVLDGTSGAAVDTMAVNRMVFDVCYMPGVDKIYCGGRAGVSVMDAATGSVITSLLLGGTQVALVPDYERNRIFCLRPLSDDVAVIDATTDSVTASVPVGAQPDAMCWNPTRKLLYVAADSSSIVSVVDPMLRRVIATVRVGGAPQDLCYVPTTDRVYCANRGLWGAPDSTVSIIDCATNTEVRRIHAGLRPGVLCFVSAHDEVYCGSAQGPITVIDVLTESVACTIPAELDVVALCYNPVHDKVYWYSEGGIVGAVDAATHGRLGYILRGMTPAGLCFSARQNKLYFLDLFDGLVVISGQSDSVVARPDIGDYTWWVSVLSTPEGDRVYCLDEGEPGVPGHLVTLDGIADTVTNVVNLPPWSCLDAAYDEVGERLYVSDIHRDLVLEFDRDGATVEDTFLVGSYPRSVFSPSPDGGLFAANRHGSSVSWVKPLAGIEESRIDELRLTKGEATVLNGDVGLRLDAASVVYDAMGRRVTKPGPGVYFVRERLVGSGEQYRTRKMIVVR